MEKSEPQWVKKFTTEMELESSKSVLEWVNVVQTIGLSATCLDNYTRIFKENVHDLYSEMIKEVKELKESVISQIQELLEKAEGCCKLLQIEMPPYGSKSLGLFEEMENLRKQVAGYEAEIAKRKNTFETLQKAQEILCKELETEPLIQTVDDLPTEKIIDELETHVKSLRSEKYKREEQFYVLQEKLQELLNCLKIDTNSNFELQALKSVPMLREADLLKLEKLTETYQKQLSAVEVEISQLRTKVEEIWGYLNFDIQDRQERREKFIGNSMNTLLALRAELKNCDDIRKANIQVFVEKLRSELWNCWDKCHFTSDEREKFQYYYTDLYNEDLLALHEIELNKVKTYYAENKELFDLYEKHCDSWKEFSKLESNDGNPNRYKNRGGQLLIEEKQRNKLNRLIQKTEERLLMLASEFFDNNGYHFLIEGKTITDYIQQMHEIREEQKKQKLSARKLTRENTALTPGKTTLSIFPSTSNLNLAASASKRKLLTPMKEVKRKKLDFSNKKVFATAPPKIVVTRATGGKRKTPNSKTWRRLSTEFKENVEPCAATKADDYKIFEEEIGVKDNNCRSTIFEKTSSPEMPLANILKESDKLNKTPMGTSIVKSPLSVTKKKFTTAVDLKQIF